MVIACAASSGLTAGVLPASAARPLPPFPAAGNLLQAQVLVHSAPRRSSPVVERLSQFRSDRYPTEILALAARRDGAGKLWYRLSLPGRPNGRRGWVLAGTVAVEPVPNRIVVYRARRLLEVRRLRGDKLLLQTRIAVGKPGAETPLGRDYYVQARFVPVDPFYGTFALETSAYSRLSDWPGGGLVGIHGTDLPQLIGQAVSHGCIRLDNHAADDLKRLAPLGTPIDILP